MSNTNDYASGKRFEAFQTDKGVPEWDKMSIATRKGDDGTTGLMYNRRVSKTHARVQACGAIDELNAGIGLARAHCAWPLVNENLRKAQEQLVGLMGELATVPADLERYKTDGYQLLGPGATADLDEIVSTIESQKVSFAGWATPGKCLASASLEMARTICRRAERAVMALHEAEPVGNPHIQPFLNRLSDVLWLLARWVEAQPA